MKKTIVTALLCTFLLSIATACGASTTGSDQTTAGTAKGSTTAAAAVTTAAASSEPAKITILSYGDKTDRMKKFAEQDLPAYLADKKININVDLQVLPWSEYAGGQTELKLASGEDFASYTDVAFMSRCIGKGYLADMTDYIAQYGKNLTEKLEDLSFKAFSSKKRIYAIPIGNKPNASEFFAIVVRQDLLEEAGMTEIKTVEDVENYYKKCIAKHPDYFGWCDGSASDTYGPVRMLSYVISDKNMEFLNELVFTDASANDDKLYSYFESEEYKKYAAIARRWNQMGIINKQIISDSAIAGSKYLAGQGMFRNGNNGRVWEELLSVQKNAPGAKLKNYFIGDAKGRQKVSRGSYSTAFQVSTNAAHPEAYVQFIDAIYADQDSFDFFTYGIKGEDYNLKDNGRIVDKKNDGVFLHEWATTHSKYMRFPDYVPDDTIAAYKVWNDGAIPQKDIGFAFELEPVKEIYAQLQNVAVEYFVPISLGFADYDSAYPEAIKRLKDAGIDQYMAEYQKQFSEFYKSKQ